MNDEKGNIWDVCYVVVYEWMNLAAKRAFSIREHIETAYDSEIRVNVRNAT